MAAAELWKEHYALQFLVLPGGKKNNYWCLSLKQGCKSSLRTSAPMEYSRESL